MAGDEDARQNTADGAAPVLGKFDPQVDVDGTASASPRPGGPRRKKRPLFVSSTAVVAPHNPSGFAAGLHARFLTPHRVLLAVYFRDGFIPTLADHIIRYESLYGGFRRAEAFEQRGHDAYARV